MDSLYYLFKRVNFKLLSWVTFRLSYTNPGSIALQAALTPAETDYLFYFARDDGSHIFTKNYQEHLDRQNELNSE
jgi:hypothetical protein